MEDESHPGGGVVFGTVLTGGSVQRFSHVWLQTPSGWRLIAAQASTIASAAANPSPATRAAGGDETTFIKGQLSRLAPEAAVVDAYRRVVGGEHAGDAKAWATWTDDHFWWIGPNGDKYGKGTRIAQIGRQKAATPLPIVHDLQVRIYGDVGIMRAIQQPIRPPDVRFTRVWVKHGDVWQQALNHATFVTEPR